MQLILINWDISCFDLWPPHANRSRKYWKGIKMVRAPKMAITAVAAIAASMSISGVANAEGHAHSGDHAHAGHNETAHRVAPAALSGQIVIVYHWPCANTEMGLSLLKTMISYERDASPHPYSAVPAIHQDGALVSIDVHTSKNSMEQAMAWQNSDERWQSLFKEMVEVCGSAEDLTTNMLIVQ